MASSPSIQSVPALMRMLSVVVAVAVLGGGVLVSGGLWRCWVVEFWSVVVCGSNYEETPSIELPLSKTVHLQRKSNNSDQMDQHFTRHEDIIFKIHTRNSRIKTETAALARSLIIKCNLLPDKCFHNAFRNLYSLNICTHKNDVIMVYA